MGRVAGVFDNPPGFPCTPPGVDILEGGKLTSRFLHFMGIFTSIKAFFSKSVHHLLSQILTFNQRIRIRKYLGCYQSKMHG